MKSTTPNSPLRELRNYLVGLADEFRTEKKFSELLEIETVSDIARDDSKRLGMATDLMVAAEHQDMTAAEMIEEVLKDGVVEQSEIQMLRNALALIRGNVQTDHRAAELVSA